MNTTNRLHGERHVLKFNDPKYPQCLKTIRKPPEELFCIGNVEALEQGLAIVGARKATPYGLSCAKRFAKLAAGRGIPIISGGARGCDSEAHKGALSKAGSTVVVLGGGCDNIYPPEHVGLFQKIVDSGSIVISEHSWDTPPIAYMFRERNRIIAGLSKAVLIVEAGLPSGTFSTADEAIDFDREVLVVPGAITSSQSRGANRLIYQGATPIIDDDTFNDQMKAIFGEPNLEDMFDSQNGLDKNLKCFIDSLGTKQSLLGVDIHKEAWVWVVTTLAAQPMDVDDLYKILPIKFKDEIKVTELAAWLSKMEMIGKITRYQGGKYGICL